MKRIFIIAALSALSLALNAQDIMLLPPSTTGGSSTTEALWNRRSVRSFSPEMLSAQDLSDLLFAAQGVNRADRNLLTSPTARNCQEIDVYAFTADGVYLYDRKAHALQHVLSGDHRELMNGRQDFPATAPIILLMVIDFEKVGSRGEHAVLMAAADGGIVSQNINLFCASRGLCTVPRGIMDEKGLAQLLNFNERYRFILNNPVGYPKK